MKSQLLFQVDYTEWATRRLLTACESLTPEQLDRDVGGSHPTIRRTLYHFHISEEFWVRCLRANAIPRLADFGTVDPPPTALDEMRRVWPGVWHDLRGYIEAASADDLAGEIRGPDCVIDRWKLIMHLVNHSSLHRGQVVSMIRQVGGKPPNTDLFTYALVMVPAP